MDKIEKTGGKMKVKMLTKVLSLAVGVALIGCAPKSAKQQEPFTYTYIDVLYAKLGSEAFVSDYADKGVSFKAMFIGEFTLTEVYKLGKIKTEGRIFINHRDVSHKLTGMEDKAMPPFALSIEKAKFDIIYGLKSGDTIEIKGLAEEGIMVGTGKKFLHIRIHEITQ